MPESRDSGVMNWSFADQSDTVRIESEIVRTGFSSSHNVRLLN